jgi:large conductance mechanosensitive channel
MASFPASSQCVAGDPDATGVQGIRAARQCGGHGCRHLIGAAFSTIVRSLVDDIVMPPFGVLTGGVDFSNIFITLNGQHYDSLAQARQAGAPTLNIGVFINNVISFLIVAVVLFMAIKAMNRLRRKQEEEPQSEPPPSREVQVLEEIRDALLDRRDRPA